MFSAFIAATKVHLLFKLADGVSIITAKNRQLERETGFGLEVIKKRHKERALQEGST